MERVVIVGGGVLGVAHALQARQRGPDVVQLEREAGARGASVRVNPALAGDFAGALLCRRDAIVEPRLVPQAFRDYLLTGQPRSGPGYAWLPGREAVEIAPHAVRDHTGQWHRGDLVVLCTGAAHTGIAGGTWPAARCPRYGGSGCRCCRPGRCRAP